MTDKLVDALRDNPIIAAVKNDEGLSHALVSECTVVFFLYGTVCNIGGLVEKAKKAGKMAFVHMDLIDGLSNKDVSADFIHEQTHADGIISIKSNLIRRGKELGLITVQRFFLLDSIAFENVLRQSSWADVVEILPGTMPKIIKKLSGQLRRPLIAGGLISDKEDIVSALGAGALAISATTPDVWFL